MNTYKLYEPPKPVGHWVLYAEATYQISFAMYHKPTPEQIENTYQMLGWTWKDAE
jgi:hypothetical protein